MGSDGYARLRLIAMGQISMTAEIRRDYERETSGLLAERWAEANFKLMTLSLQ